jgi:hypothetical protein
VFRDILHADFFSTLHHAVMPVGFLSKASQVFNIKRVVLPKSPMPNHEENWGIRGTE